MKARCDELIHDLIILHNHEIIGLIVLHDPFNLSVPAFLPRVIAIAVCAHPINPWITSLDLGKFFPISINFQAFKLQWGLEYYKVWYSNGRGLFCFQVEFCFPMVDKMAAILFGPDHWKTKILASLDHYT